MTDPTPTRDEAVPAGWRYSINYGPDGEQNFANVYAAEGQFVGNLRTHHAIAICNAFAVCEKLASTPAPASGGVDAVAWRDVLAERRRQIEAEGWTPKHDDSHAGGEMARAAACYAAHASAWQRLPVKLDSYRSVEHYRMSVGWPWAEKWWKPTDPRRDLVKAGALILAEIERLDRAALSASFQPELSSGKREMTDYDMSIHTNPDAVAWAKFYVRTREAFEVSGREGRFDDEANMIGWFANAMMAMHDHLTGQRVTVLPDGSAFFVAAELASLSPAATPVSEAGGAALALDSEMRNAEFETWARKNGCHLHLHEGGEDRRYGYDLTERAWLGWCAALAKPASSPAGGDGVREAIEKLPRRVEPISGQRFSYVKLEDVLAVFDSAASSSGEKG